MRFWEESSSNFRLELLLDTYRYGMELHGNINLHAMPKKIDKDALIDARKRMGLSQEKVAQATGTSQATISGLERGTTNVSASTEARIQAWIDSIPAYLWVLNQKGRRVPWWKLEVWISPGCPGGSSRQKFIASASRTLLR